MSFDFGIDFPISVDANGNPDLDIFSPADGSIDALSFSDFSTIFTNQGDMWWDPNNFSNVLKLKGMAVEQRDLDACAAKIDTYWTGDAQIESSATQIELTAQGVVLIDRLLVGKDGTFISTAAKFGPAGTPSLSTGTVDKTIR
jgi:hypothetical protein